MKFYEQDFSVCRKKTLPAKELFITMLFAWGAPCFLVTADFL